VRPRALSYDAIGATRPADAVWADPPAGFRPSAGTVEIGRGKEVWDKASRAVLDWQVKTRSGFAVTAVAGGAIRVEKDADYVLKARFGPISVEEPVRVVAVVDEPDRCGFAYGTLDGHPVRGEEAFVVHRSAEGVVFLTLRSLTAAPAGRWLAAYPVALVAQRWYRRRYLRALLSTD
jgi:uncharacterized protein (UPF0548 family)